MSGGDVKEPLKLGYTGYKHNAHFSILFSSGGGVYLRHQRRGGGKPLSLKKERGFPPSHPLSRKKLDLDMGTQNQGGWGKLVSPSGGFGGQSPPKEWSDM